MRSLLLFLALVAVGAWAVARHLPESQAQAGAGAIVSGVRPQEIRSISLDGRNLPLAALRDVLTSHAGDLVDLAALARDRALLEEALVARGYLAAKVDDARVTFGAGGATFVTFPIETGPMFRIRNVTVSGARAQDAGVVTLGAGETADAARITQARQALEARLGVRDQPSLVLTHLVPDVAAGLVDIELTATH